MSILTVNTGCMFSGKSTTLINQGEIHAKAGQKVVYVKPTIDNRYKADSIVTHSGISVPALTIGISDNLSGHLKLDDVDVVLIDEVQFFTQQIVASIWWLLSEGKVVYASGLDMNYMTGSFDTMNEVLAMADIVHKLKAICDCCGGKANISAKKDFFNGLKYSDGKIIEIGEKDIYFPVCRECFFKLVKNGGM